MSRTANHFVISRRNDSKTFQVTLNPACGLPKRVCDEWRRRSFHVLPDELTQYRYPKTKTAADAAAVTLINCFFSKIQL